MTLVRRLQADGFPLAGTVLNRVHRLPPAAPHITDLTEHLSMAGSSDPPVLAAAVLDSLADTRAVAVRDLDLSEALARAAGEPPAAVVPAFTREPVDVAGLARVASALADSDSDSATHRWSIASFE